MKTKLLLSAFCLIIVQFTYGQWFYTTLSEPKSAMGCTSSGNKAWFAGGSNYNGEITAVEVYDVNTQQCDTIGNLSVARTNPAAVACGNKVVVGGGAIWMSSVLSQVDIYDTSNQQWSQAQLTEARFLPSAVSHGDTVLFAGGFTDFYMNTSYNVDIYNVETGIWSIDYLSIQRGSMACAVVGDLAIFAGGFVNQNYISDRVDIYNFSTQTWDTATLSEPRAFCEAATVGNKVLIAGGIKAINVPSKVVDIYDASTNTWSTDSLSVPRALPRAATVNGKAYFVGGATFNFGWHDFSTVIDIYDGATGAWSADSMVVPRIALVAGVSSHLVIAGGELSATELTDLVEVLDVPVGIDESMVGGQRSAVMSYPNPIGIVTTFEYELQEAGVATLTIFNNIGQEVATLVNEQQSIGMHEVRWNAEGLPAGIYFYQLRAKGVGQVGAGKIVKY